MFNLYIGIQTVNSVLCRSPLWQQLQLWVFLGKSLQGLYNCPHLNLGSLSHSSCYIISSSIRLHGKHMWTAIFWSFNRCSMEFKSGLWLGHSRMDRDLSQSLSSGVFAVCFGSGHCGAERWTIAPVRGHMPSGAGFLQGPLGIWWSS